jgi:predicted nucleic acid-binding protein
MIVLDANIIVRAVLGRKVRDLIENYSRLGVRFTAPDEAFLDADRHLPEILKKFGKHDVDISPALRYLRCLIEVLDYDLYSAFEAEARKRLRGRDEDDWPVLASALAFGCAVWTEDADFFGTGVAVWNTSRIEIFLESQLKDLEGT